MDYQIKPIELDAFGVADGVYVNDDGAWLGEMAENMTDDGQIERTVLPYANTTNDGEYVPAPENWEELIITQL